MEVWVDRIWCRNFLGRILRRLLALLVLGTIVTWIRPDPIPPGSPPNELPPAVAAEEAVFPPHPTLIHPQQNWLEQSAPVLVERAPSPDSQEVAPASGDASRLPVSPQRQDSPYLAHPLGFEDREASPILSR